jgi:hypothetical protein
MCLIIDANVAWKFDNPPHPDVKPVVKWLLDKHKKKPPRVVIGGKLRAELKKAGDAFLRFRLILAEAGRLLDIADHRVDTEEAEVENLLQREKIHGADDPHILALARVSGSRLLASADKRSRLHELFTNRLFLDPPGKVYQKTSHRHLLRRAPNCKD